MIPESCAERFGVAFQVRVFIGCAYELSEIVSDVSISVLYW